MNCVVRNRLAAPLLAGLLLWNFAPVAPGQQAGTPAKPYFDPSRVDGIALLPPPPSPGSAEEAADLASARAIFKGRTPEQEAHALKSATLSLWLFAPAIGPVFEKGRLPKVEALMERVKKDMSGCIDVPKNHYKRLRPYKLDPELSLAKPEPSHSYPSGHSTRGTTYSLLLAEIFPDKREAILEVGRNIGWDRIIIGKHFPIDVFAGRVLGRAVAREFLANPEFRQALAEARAEVEAACAK